jgi:hypothetical protein
MQLLLSSSQIKQPTPIFCSNQQLIRSSWIQNNVKVKAENNTMATSEILWTLSSTIIYESSKFAVYKWCISLL